MDAKIYQEKAMKTKNNAAHYKLHEAVLYMPIINNIEAANMINASLGLSGEVGELNDLIKKVVFHGKEMDTEHIKKEIGDVLWYVALMCDSFGFDMGEIMSLNIEKLEKRYPDGFSEFLSNNRSKNDV